MTFEEWLKENSIDKDEYFSISDMTWYAEIAWKAGYREGKQNKENTL